MHQERNWTYVLVEDAGHLVPQQQATRAVAMVRDFVLGHKKTGLVLPNGKVVGGEDPKLAQDFIPEGDKPIWYGSATSASSTVWPAATRKAWSSHLATALKTPAPAPTSTPTPYGQV